ncbi:MAG: hypothetical protein PHO41_07265 [Eubacteriales bacterium]|nr:hypothetical protein [Eubacteriales bacterium]
MATTFTGLVRAVVSGTFVNVLDLGNVTDGLSKGYSTSFADGTGSGKAQVQFHDQRTLLTTNDETLDLTALVGAFGAAAFTKIKALVISVVTQSNGYRLQIGGAAENAHSAMFADPADVLEIQAGATLMLTAPVNGYTVDATHKNLKIANPSGGSVTYDIIIIGEGAVS